MALTSIGAGAAPAFAAPQPTVQFQLPESLTQKVQYREKRRIDRRIERRQDCRASNRFERRGNYYYYNGWRGYRKRRAGHRHFNGIWFPSAAFITGATVGSAIANQPQGTSSHLRWCADRYRSYRAYDNTLQPYNGARQQC
jgi:hypothetical protein